MSENSFCRLCALKSDSYVKVFDQQGENLQLAVKIRQCLQILLEPEDLLPNIVCLTCCQKVNEFSEFFVLCTQSQTSLMELLSFQKDILLSRDFEQLGNQIFNHIPNKDLQVSSEAFKTAAKEVTDEYIPRKCSTLHKKYQPKISSQGEPSTTLEDKNHKNDKQEASTDDDEWCSDNGWFKNIFEVPKPVSTRKMMEGYVWKCSDCGKEVPSLSSLKLHYYQEHEKAPSFKCTNCDKVYTRYRSFVRHVKIHWSHECFTCNICGKDFTQKGILQSHMISHSEERPFVCSECGKAFKQYSSLYLHSKCHLPNEAKPKFPCSVCSKIFCSKHAMETHMKMHTGEKNFICDICGKRFIAKGSLDYHIKAHDERKPYSCEICNKCFKTARLLSKHAMLHTGEKPHQCDVCGKQFRERGGLKEHTRIHTGDMPYSCEFCGKLFRFKGILTVHRRQHTGERPYQCAICHREFTNWANYNKHLKRRHKPGSEGESESELTAQINQQDLQQSEIRNADLLHESIGNTTPLITTNPAVQDVFSLEPTIYDNLPLDLGEPLSDLYRLPPQYTHPSPPLALQSSSASAIQLYCLQRYVRYPDFVPLVSISSLPESSIEEIVPHPR